MAKRNREVMIRFRVNPEERELIEAKMAQLGTSNMAAYLRKMAIDGYVVRLDLLELREMVSLLRRTSNNVNQIAKRINETRRFYDSDVEEILRNQARLWDAANEVLTALAKIR